MYRTLLVVVTFLLGVATASAEENVSVTNGVFCSSQAYVETVLKNIEAPGLEGLLRAVDATNGGKDSDGSICHLFNLPVIVEGESTVVGEGTYLGETVPIVQMQVPKVFLPSVNGSGLLLSLEKPFEVFTFRSKQIPEDQVPRDKT